MKSSPTEIPAAAAETRPADGSPAGSGPGPRWTIEPALSRKISATSFWLIFLVILIHARTRPAAGSVGPLTFSGWATTFVQETISEGFARAAVPLYFAISGFLFFQGYAWRAAFFARKLRSRLGSLVVPYALWSGGCVVAYLILQSIPGIRAYCGTTIIRDLGASEVAKRFALDPIPVQLWYLRDLFLLCLLTPILGPLLRKVPGIILAGLVLAWLMDVNFFPGLALQMKLLNPEGLLFFSLGGAIALRGTGWGPRLPLIVPIAWVAACLVRAQLALADPGTPWGHPLHCLIVLTGVWTLWCLPGRFPASDRLRGRNSIESYGVFIFLAHVPLISFVTKVLSSCGRSPWMPLLSYFGGLLLTFAACLGAGIALKRFSPRAFALLTGGR